MSADGGEAPAEIRRLETGVPWLGPVGLLGGLQDRHLFDQTAVERVRWRTFAADGLKVARKWTIKPAAAGRRRATAAR